MCLRGRKLENPLCSRCGNIFIWDASQQYFRRRKKNMPPIRWKMQRALTELLSCYFDTVDSEVAPLWARSPITGALLRYDIAIPSHKILIEYNGDQHIDQDSMKYWIKRCKRKTSVSIEFRKRQYLDKVKKQLADRHKWKLIILSGKISQGTYDTIIKEYNKYSEKEEGDYVSI